MKRFSLVLVLLLLAVSLFAVSFGYDFSYEGYSLDENSHNSFTVSAACDLFSDRNVNIELGAKFGFDESGFGFMGGEALLGLSPFDFLHHPLTFMFTNRTNLSPEVEVGVVTYKADETYIRFGFSPAHLEDVNFTYDFFNPFVLFKADGFDYEGWGIELVRATYYFN